MADVAAVLLDRADLQDLSGTGYPGSVAEQVGSAVTEHTTWDVCVMSHICRSCLS